MSQVNPTWQQETPSAQYQQQQSHRDQQRQGPIIQHCHEPPPNHVQFDLLPQQHQQHLAFVTTRKRNMGVDLSEQHFEAKRRHVEGKESRSIYRGGDGNSRVHDNQGSMHFGNVNPGLELHFSGYNTEGQHPSPFMVDNTAARPATTNSTHSEHAAMLSSRLSSSLTMAPSAMPSLLTSTANGGNDIISSAVTNSFAGVVVAPMSIPTSEQQQQQQQQEAAVSPPLTYDAFQARMSEQAHARAAAERHQAQHAALKGGSSHDTDGGMAMDMDDVEMDGNGGVSEFANGHNNSESNGNGDGGKNGLVKPSLDSLSLRRLPEGRHERFGGSRNPDKEETPDESDGGTDSPEDEYDRDYGQFHQHSNHYFQNLSGTNMVVDTTTAAMSLSSLNSPSTPSSPLSIYPTSAMSSSGPTNFEGRRRERQHSDHMMTGEHGNGHEYNSSNNNSQQCHALSSRSPTPTPTMQSAFVSNVTAAIESTILSNNANPSVPLTVRIDERTAPILGRSRRTAGSPMAMLASPSSSTSPGSFHYVMGYRPDCERCRRREKGHFAHLE